MATYGDGGLERQNQFTEEIRKFLEEATDDNEEFIFPEKVRRGRGRELRGVRRDARRTSDAGGRPTPTRARIGARIHHVGVGWGQGEGRCCCSACRRPSGTSFAFSRALPQFLGLAPIPRECGAGSPPLPRTRA